MTTISNPVEDKKIIESIVTVQNGNAAYQNVFTTPYSLDGKNEFLFFIKPEITLPNSTVNLESVLNMILDKLDSFELGIKNISVLSANYLKEYNIIAQHYGVINSIATDARKNLSESALEKFNAIYGKSADECNLMGGVEFLEKYPTFNALSLDFLWQNKENKKLAGGTYCEDIKMDGEVVHLVNGFHPRQLVHFTETGRSIVIFTLVSDLSWTDARNKLIGSTNPAKAESSSIRRNLLDNREAYGLAEVSQGVNGVHLSAGPVEGLVELVRYNSNFADTSAIKTIADFAFGKMLMTHFADSQIEAILANANVNYEGKTISIFDLTEEKDSDEAIALLKQVL
jgi:hypothetical protein